MAGRCLSGEALDGFATYAEAEPADHVVVRMRPEHWLSADPGAVG
ncbi:hypothetical protein [Streptomyces panaciradicis]|nr:hypothetical protein [Streptomyces panaciradicis]